MQIMVGQALFVGSTAIGLGVWLGVTGLWVYGIILIILLVIVPTLIAARQRLNERKEIKQSMPS